MKKVYKGWMDYVLYDEIIQAISGILDDYYYTAEKKFIKASYSGSRLHVRICLKIKSNLSIK